MLSSLVIASCTMLFQQVAAQTWSNAGNGTGLDRWTVNDDNSNHWAHLRLQASTTHAWNMLNEGDLWWGYASNSDHNDRGAEKLRLYTNGNLRGIATFISGTGSGALPSSINWADTRGFLIRQESDNAFFGLVNRIGENGGVNAYNTVLYFGDDVDDDLQIQSYYGGEIMRVTADAMIGIGTTNPTERLHINGNLRVDGGQFQSWGPVILHPDTDNNGDDIVQFLNSIGQENMRIHADGNVGIGTSSPRGKLDVTGGNIYLSDDTNVGTNQSIFLPGHIYMSPYSGSNITYLQARRQDNSGTTSLRVRTYNNGALTEAMQIQGNGNVGIGTTNPGAKLEVYAGDLLLKGLGDDAGDLLFQKSTGVQLGRIWSDPSGISSLYLSSGDNNPDLTINDAGNVAIGTTTADAKLTVKGNIHTQEVLVDLNGAVAPDFVFEPGYELRSLPETEAYIKENKHLPEIPSAAEMQANGVELKTMNLKLLQKIEELTLYVIEQGKKMEGMEKEIIALKKR